MLGIIGRSSGIKRLLATLLAVVLAWGATSCSRPEGAKSPVASLTRSRLAEVSPPFVLQNLKQMLDKYQPQVKILSPRSNQTLEDTDVEVKLQVNDLPLFKDAELELGPYLQVWLDNQPYAQIYDLNEPLKLENLAPGTHTLRAFAVRPWHESFKNEGAFAQTTFHVFTPTPENNPAPNQPLLTYNYPLGVYGAEPALLDFHLTNAPLHLVARENSQDAIPDWQIRCTINGESFSFDRWEPIYLKGLKPGKNWVQLELLDEQGQVIPNVFNTAVQLVTYEPGGSDTLAKMTRGELTVEEVGKIVDPNYMPPPPPPVFTPEPEPIAPEPTLEPESTPEPEATEPEESQPLSEPEVILEPDLTQEPIPETMPPEIMPDEPGEPAELKLTEPTLIEPQPEPVLERFNSSIEEPQPPALMPIPGQPTEPPVIKPDLPIGPAVKVFPPETEQTQLNVVEPPASIQEAEVDKAPQRFPAIYERQPDRLQPQPLPTLSPSTPPKSSFTEPDADLSAQEQRKAMEEKIEQGVQPTGISPQSIAAPEFLQTTAAEPVPLIPTNQLELKPTSSLESGLLQADNIPAIEPTAPAIGSSANPTIPNLVGVFDRVQGFFESLRKQPAKAPLLESLFEESATSSESIEDLLESTQLEQSSPPVEPVLTAPAESDR